MSIIEVNKTGGDEIINGNNNALHTNPSPNMYSNHLSPTQSAIEMAT